MKNIAAQQLGKLGGKARKKQRPDYSAMGKKGMAKRWGKKARAVSVAVAEKVDATL